MIPQAAHVNLGKMRKVGTMQRFGNLNDVPRIDKFAGNGQERKSAQAWQDAKLQSMRAMAQIIRFTPIAQVEPDKTTEVLAEYDEVVKDWNWAQKKKERKEKQRLRDMYEALNRERYWFMEDGEPGDFPHSEGYSEIEEMAPDTPGKARRPYMQETVARLIGTDDEHAPATVAERVSALEAITVDWFDEDVSVAGAVASVLQRRGILPKYGAKNVLVRNVEEAVGDALGRLCMLWCSAVHPVKHLKDRCSGEERSLWYNEEEGTFEAKKRVWGKQVNPSNKVEYKKAAHWKEVKKWITVTIKDENGKRVEKEEQVVVGLRFIEATHIIERFYVKYMDEAGTLHPYSPDRHGTIAQARDHLWIQVKRRNVTKQGKEVRVNYRPSELLWRFAGFAASHALRLQGIFEGNTQTALTAEDRRTGAYRMNKKPKKMRSPRAIARFLREKGFSRVGQYSTTRFLAALGEGKGQSEAAKHARISEDAGSLIRAAVRKHVQGRRKVAIMKDRRYKDKFTER